MVALAHHVSFYYAKSVSFELSCHFNFAFGILANNLYPEFSNARIKKKNGGKV